MEPTSRMLATQENQMTDLRRELLKMTSENVELKKKMNRVLRPKLEPHELCDIKDCKAPARMDLDSKYCTLHKRNIESWDREFYKTLRG